LLGSGDTVTTEGRDVMQRALLGTAVLTLGLAFPPSPAEADPIRITGGSAVFDEEAVANVDVHGLQGFHAQFTNLLLNNTGPWQFFPSPPGTLIPPNAFIESIDGAGTAEFRGVSYALGTTNATLPGEAVVHILPIGPPVTVPPLVGPGAILKTSFELSSIANLELPQDVSESHSVGLTGRGTMTIKMVPNAFAPIWEFAGVRYDFAPTPEPGTLTLLSTAVGVFVLRKYRRLHN
jgi:hypothetical protein